MPQPRPLTEDPAGWKSREVRLGVVLYGGVSLAIYINGVTRELFDAVHGRGVYKLAKVLTDSDVVVDVVSGTSAGGINGIMLAYALCNGREFGDAASLWRRDGGIRQLLRDPLRAATDWVSILDSEGYYQPAIEGAFRHMGSYVRESGEEPTEVGELDLHITGTDVDGRVWTQFDDAGHPIDVKDHRAVFKLKHRPGRVSPFGPGRNEPFNPRPEGLGQNAPVYESVTFEALGKLSRLTSCFPAAFAPVHVRVATDPVVSADARLQQWGRLGKESAFLDGGVLDNKPFTHTLGAIFSRHADRRVKRKLIYVEPDPETFQRRLEASRPNIVQAVVTALIGIPGYESISNDLKLIADHNSRVEQYRRIVTLCEHDLAAPAKAPRAPETAPPAPDLTRQLYERSRLVELSDRVVRGVLRRDGRDRTIDGPEREIASRLVRAFDEVTSVPREVFDAFDVMYRQRRLYHVVYQIYRTLYANGDPPPDERATHYRATWRAFNRQLELLDVIRAVMEWVIDEAPIAWDRKPPAEVWASVEAMYEALLQRDYPSMPRAWQGDAEAGTTAWLDTARLSRLYRELAARVREIVEGAAIGEIPASGDDAPGNLLSRCDALELEILNEYLPADDPIRRAYDRFDEIDQHVFPLELLGGLQQKDVVPTLRISPRDAELGFSKRGFSDKIAGDALYHFGGFFKRSWRSNDILWGRLDGGCQLLELLLARDRLVQIAASPGLRRKVRERFCPPTLAQTTSGRFTPALDPANLFPRAGTQTHTEIGDWLIALFSEDAGKRDAALEKDVVARKIELIVEAAQLEVIHDELPNVMTDALEEQAEWSEVPTERKPQPDPPPDPSGTKDWVFKPLDQSVDPFVATIAAAERMRATMRSASPAEHDVARPRATVLGRFFQQSYRVGTETVARDIPPRVFLEILAVALLVARNCVLSAFGAHAEKIRRNPLYWLFIAVPLRAFYLITVGLRGSAAKRNWTIALVGLGALAVAIWCGFHAFEDGKPSWSNILWGVAALVVLIVDVLVGWQISGPRRSYESYVSHIVTEPEKGAAVAGFFRAEWPRSGRRIKASILEAGVWLPDRTRPPVTFRAMRLAIESDGGSTPVATSKKWSFGKGVHVRGSEPVPLGQKTLTITLPAECDPARHRLVVQLLHDGKEERWTTFRAQRVLEETAA